MYKTHYSVSIVANKAHDALTKQVNNMYTICFVIFLLVEYAPSICFIVIYSLLQRRLWTLCVCASFCLTVKTYPHIMAGRSNYDLMSV